jgi:hypothetical protein
MWSSVWSESFDVVVGGDTRRVTLATQSGSEHVLLKLLEEMTQDASMTCFGRLSTLGRGGAAVMVRCVPAARRRGAHGTPRRQHCEGPKLREVDRDESAS